VRDRSSSGRLGEGPGLGLGVGGRRRFAVAHGGYLFSESLTSPFYADRYYAERRFSGSAFAQNESGCGSGREILWPMGVGHRPFGGACS